MNYDSRMMKVTRPLILLIVLITACTKNEPTPAPTQVALAVTVTVIPTTTLTPSPTPTATATLTPTVTPTPTNTATPSLTPTSLPTAISWVEGGTPLPGSGDTITVENAAQVTELAHWGRGTITDIDLSADGNWVAVASGVGVTIHDAHDLAAATRFIPTNGNVSAVSISPIGDKVALVIQQSELQVWQVEPLQQLYTVPGFAEKLQFSPDGSVLGGVKIGETESGVKLLDVNSGTQIGYYYIRYAPDFTFSPNSSQIAIWSQADDTVFVYDWQDNQLIWSKKTALRELESEYEYFPKIADVFYVTEDDLRFLIVEDNYVSLSGRIEVQQVNSDEILFSADAIDYLSEATNGVCNEPIFYADPPQPPIPYHMEISVDQQIAVLRYEDAGYSGDYGVQSSVRFFEVASGKKLYSLEEGIVDFELSPDGQTWIAGFQDGRLQVRQLRDGTVLDSVDSYDSPILDLTISPDGQQVGVVYVDEVKVYRREDGTVLYRYLAVAISFALEETWFALGYADGRIELRSMADGTLIHWVTAHQDRVTALAFLLTGELLSAGLDCNLRISEMPNLIQTNSLENYIVESSLTGEQVAVRVSKFLIMPDGARVIGLFFDMNYEVWSVADGHRLQVPKQNYGPGILAIAPDGKYAVFPYEDDPGSWDSSITFLPTWAESVAFSPDSSLLVEGFSDWPRNGLEGAVQLRNISSLDILKTVAPHTTRVMAIAFTPDGQLVVSGALDGVIRLWGIP